MENKIDYTAIIKKAIQITLNNKVLWWFGFLAIFSGGYLSFNYTFPGKSSDNKLDEVEYLNIMRRVSFYWGLYWEWIILAIVLLILLLIGLYILGLIGRGALISSIFKIIKEEKISFSAGFKRGLHFWGRLLLLNLFFSLVLMLLIFILFFPVVRLIIFESYITAVGLGLVACLLLISMAILFFYLRRYGELYLIGNDLNISNSVKLAYQLIGKNIKESFIMGLVLMGVNLVIGIGVVLIILGISIPVWIGGSMLHKVAGESMVLISGVIVVFGFVGLIIFIQSILNVFFEAIWVLFFYEIAGKKEEVARLAEKEKAINLDTETESGITLSN